MSAQVASGDFEGSTDIYFDGQGVPQSFAINFMLLTSVKLMAAENHEKKVWKEW